MLLMVEALLLILAALLQDHRAAAEEQIFPLDMAENSVDDRYHTCRDNMANEVKTEYLKKELKNSEELRIAWKKGKEAINPKQLDNPLTENHLIAIYVYTGSDVFQQFNNDSRNGKKKYKSNTYEWYSLYFLLTDAIQILRKIQNKCYDTYRRTKHEFNKDVLNKEIRFGSFASSSGDHNRTFFGNKSCFEIHTCEGTEITQYSKLPLEKEVLIPPYEKFKVTAVKTRKDQKDLWCDTVYTLKSSGRRSDLNCALFKKNVVVH